MNCGVDVNGVIAKWLQIGFESIYCATTCQTYSYDRCEATGDLNKSDIVLVIDHQLVRAQWPVVEIVETFHDGDGHVMAAIVNGKGCVMVIKRYSVCFWQ